jgi:acyl-ACP thioesterase
MVSGHETLKTRQDFTVKVRDTGPDKRLTVAALWDYMQEVAWNNAANLGFSVYDLHQRGITWVVYRLKFMVNAYPDHGESFSVVTWPSGMDKYFVYRDFQVFDSAHNKIGEATSTWLVFDLKKRKFITNLHEELLGLYSGKEVDHLPRAEGKLQKVRDHELSKQFQVEWFDLDVNEHANNSFFIQWVLQCMDPVVHRSLNLHILDIQFKKECSYGDKLECFVSSTGEDSFQHEITKSNGETAILAQSFWRKRLIH